MLSLDEIIRATGGKPQDLPDLSVEPSGVSTDSRTLEQGELFVALKGPNFDGHDFTVQAFEKGAVAALVSKDVSLPRTILVPDTLNALGDAAIAYRRKFDIPVVVITGTNGKTTTKNLLSDLLNLKYKTYANPGNLNNLIGMPLSIFELAEDHEIAVLEAGINHKSELTRLAEIASPSIGLITNIGPGHLEGIGTLEDVLDAKWELARAVKEREGVVYFDSVYPALVERAEKEGIRFKTFTADKEAEADFKPSSYSQDTEGISFTIRGQEIGMKLLGVSNLSNAVAALSIAISEFNIPLDQAAGALEKARPEKWRFEHRMIGDIHLLLDCYNANPVSMHESLGLLTLFPSPRIAVLGAMLELGEESKRYHHEILELARDIADLVIITGPYSELYPRHEGVIFIPDKKKAAEELRKRLVPGATVLVKGSRGCGLEDVAAETWGSL
ncbi:UDP-N-acetylmuramoyl-tripeptide--D-alanyl-D-alanine ligase [candidate division WOR-3 bacterium]|uniref:UDP-N-acetylmuramoyl-tripeptide--D-alanyl-D-alanine ligase n=1 Tax=candidate division WOR-3 bacterium TaxID=2052148 RepID=A0A9D5QCN6_UNCW3|nr:UDP-N-acetylmuramoyl-tripeptide--D-alanyl-D-alanine ligase [candidate division WOR-3 bacterium]MBD3364873.1 UDP-N-acetylmuramoyl-tripeptide--D-alanyl-D-alanine ligase [candidate division WOR-3 bacterium]